MIDETLEVILLKETINPDAPLTETGEPNVIKNSQTVCAQRMSITQSEYYSSREKGLEPEMCLKVYCFEYNQERFCVVNDVKYEIYRTYQKTGSEFIELYLKLDIQ